MSYVHSASASLHQCVSELNAAFFNPCNVAHVQQEMRRAFYQRTGYRIDVQREDDVITLMREAFLLNSRHLDTDIPGQVKRLNEIVVDRALPMIARSVEARLAYVRDASQMYTVMARGESTTIHGQNAENTLAVFEEFNRPSGHTVGGSSRSVYIYRPLVESTASLGGLYVRQW